FGTLYGNALKVDPQYTGVIVQDVEIIARNTVDAAICCSFTLLRADVTGGADMLNFGSNMVVKDSYLHHTAPRPGGHSDAMQTRALATTSNVLIDHNTMIMQSGNTIPEGFTTTPFNSVFITCGGTCTTNENLTFSNNLFDGGGYTFQCNFLGASNVVLTGNRFGRDYAFGPQRECKGANARAGVSFDDTNVFDNTGLPI
ncbi:MAG: hypothetical protein AAB553_05105, partial [Patescibacteria group bacterium]